MLSVFDICASAKVLSRAAWHGARIILRQISPESTTIFDLIIEMFLSCQGHWETLALRTGVSMSSIELFLDYAAVFLGNLGDYYVRMTVSLKISRC